MVRTYSGMNATTSRIGELFDIIVKENERVSSRPNSNSEINRPSSVPLEQHLGNMRTQSMPKLHGIPIRKEEAVYSGNTQLAHEDYEREMRTRERQQRLIYMRDLQRQLEEQREQRLRTEIAFGGHEFEKELLKHQRQYGNNNGGQISNSIGGSNIQGRKSGLDKDYENYLRAAELEQKRDYALSLMNQQQPPIQQYQPYQPRIGIPTARGYTPTFATNSVSNSASLSASIVRRERSVPNGLNLFNNTATEFSNGFASSPVTFVPDASYQRSNGPKKQSWEQTQNEVYDPWGKGGAGAPIRDRHGRLITDRRFLQKSWTTMLDTNMPHEFNQNGYESSAVPNGTGTGNGTVPTGPVSPVSSNRMHRVPSERDLYKEDLRNQMEEQKRLKELEKEKQRLEDERDRLRMEREIERQRREMEEERKKQREKAERGLKRAEIAEGRTNEIGEGSRRTRTQVDDGLEWWERQPQTDSMVRSNSANEIKKKTVDPPPQGGPNHRGSPSSTVRDSSDYGRSSFNADQDNSDFRRSPSSSVRDNSDNLRLSFSGARENSDHHRSKLGAGQENSDHRRSPLSSNRDYSDHRRSASSEHRSISHGHHSRNQSAIERNEKILSQLTAMRERLNKEQMRVRSAIRRREYNEEFLEDNDDSSRPRNIPISGHPTGQKGRPIAFNIGNDDPPLVKLIKNSRTLDSATIRRPPPMSNTINRMRNDEESPEMEQVPGTTTNGISDHSHRISRRDY